VSGGAAGMSRWSAGCAERCSPEGQGKVGGAISQIPMTPSESRTPGTPTVTSWLSHHCVCVRVRVCVCVRACVVNILVQK